MKQLICLISFFICLSARAEQDPTLAESLQDSRSLACSNKPPLPPAIRLIAFEDEKACAIHRQIRKIMVNEAQARKELGCEVDWNLLETNLRMMDSDLRRCPSASL
jgi:hypothetical protein